MNPYEELGVALDATEDQVRKAYRKQSKSAHPDAGGDRARAGYSIPLAKEWMFWPMGYRPPAGFTGVVGEVITVTAPVPPPGFKHEPLARRYKITNVGEYTKALLRLGAIREVT